MKREEKKGLCTHTLIDHLRCVRDFFLHHDYINIYDEKCNLKCENQRGLSVVSLTRSLLYLFTRRFFLIER